MTVVAQKMTPTVDQIAKLQFVKKLAATDKETRDKGFQMLSKWMRKRSDLSLKVLRKLWKALFYCMWHSDNAPVQLELANSMAHLIDGLELTMALKYFTVFLHTMRREWFGIDRLRIEKFYMLIRSFLVAIFSLSAQNNWAPKVVKKFMRIIRSHALLSADKYTALGVNLHFADIYIEELQKARNLSDSGLNMLLEPFFEALVHSKEKGLLNRVSEVVFGKLFELTRSFLEEGSDESTVSGLCEEDLKKLIEKLFDAASDPATTGLNRKVLYSVHEKANSLLKFMETRVKEKSALEEKKIGSQGNGSSEKPQKKKKNKKKSSEGNASGGGTNKEIEEVENGNAASPVKKLTENDAEKSVSQGNGVEEKSQNLKPEVEKKKKKKKKKGKQAQSGVSNPEVNEGTVAEESQDKEEEVVVSNLTNIFESMKTTPVKTRNQAKRKAEEALDGKKTSKSGKKVEDSKKANEGEKQTKKSKRVKFNLRMNLEFAKGGPVPPPSLRTPPNAAPKGSALKAGVKPGPVNKVELNKSSVFLKQLASISDKQRKSVRRPRKITILRL